MPWNVLVREMPVNGGISGCQSCISKRSLKSPDASSAPRSARYSWLTARVLPRGHSVRNEPAMPAWMAISGLVVAKYLLRLQAAGIMPMPAMRMVTW